MSRHQTLTGAEIAFLLTLAEPAAATTARERLRLAAPPDLAPVGLSSLVARELAVPAADGIALVPDLQSVLDGLTRPHTCVSVGMIAGDTADGAQLYDAADSRFLIGPRAFGCFSVAGVDRQASMRAVLTDLAATFLAAHCPAAVFMRVETADARGGASVGLNAAGGWSTGTSDDPDPDPQPHESAAAALAHFGGRLEELLSPVRSG